MATNIVLVTGGGGYIGSVLVEKLIGKGFNVRVFDKFYFGKDPLRYLGGKIEIFEGDVRKIPQNLFDNVASLIHLAALSNDPTANFAPRTNFEVNTQSTVKLAKAAKKAGVAKFIFASSCSIYDEGLGKDGVIKNESWDIKPTALYSASKYQAEKELLKLADDNFSVVIFRKGTVFGFSPRMRYDLVVNTMVAAALETGVIKVYCQGRQWRPLVDVEDVAKAYILALKSRNPALDGEIFNLAFGNFQIKDVAKAVENALRNRFSIQSTVIFEEDNKLDRSYQVENVKAAKLLNFTPSISIEASVTKMVEKIKNRRLTDFENPIYYNINWMRPFLEKEIRET